MVVTLAVCVLAVVVLVVLGWAVFARERTDETERFNRARQITNSWAEPGPRLQLADVQPADSASEPAGRPVGGADPRPA